MGKLFTYRFSDGVEIQREATRETMEEIERTCSEKGVTLVFNGFHDQLDSLQLLRANSHSRGDGFKPGWHPSLGMEIRSHGQYQQELKARGLIEVGNEKQKNAPKKRKGLSEETVKMAVQMGAEISGQEAEKLIKGEKL